MNLSPAQNLGLVVHGKYSNQIEFMKVIRVQAKKVAPSGTAVIDLDQAATLLQTDNLGYYLFYHAPDPEKWQLAPTIVSADEYSSNVEARKEKRTSPREELGTESIAVRDDGFDFASFVTFAFADPASPHGRVAGSAREAVNIVMGGNGGGPPSRVLVIHMGNDFPSVDWPHQFGEYLSGYSAE